METIIGLGSAGCNIAEKFLQYPQYSVCLIDTEERDAPTAKFYLMDKQESHEDYEQAYPDLSAFFSGINTSCLLILGGSGMISGCALRVLQQISHLNVSVLYIKPEMELLSQTKRLQNNVVYGILQEYARSAVLEKFYVVQNSKLVEILGDLPVIGYYDKINSLITHTIHMTNIFKNSRSVMNTFSSPMPAARIASFGVMDLENGKEKTFFDLNMPRERVYYYALNRSKLREDNNLLKVITEQVTDKTDGGLVKASYGIYETDYDEDYVYSIAYTTMIQKEENSA